MLWKFFDLNWLLGLFERAMVSWACWGLGMQRDASQQSDARQAEARRALAGI